MSQLNSTVPSGDRNYSNELKKKERRIKELEERLKKPQKKTDPKQPPSKKPVKTPSESGSKPAGGGSTVNAGMPQGKPVENLNEKPLTVDERDCLIKQIGLLSQTQSEGIIEIVAEFAHKDDNNQVTFELTQLPIFKCRGLQAYVKKCIADNEKKKKRKEKDQQRRMKKREEQQKQKQQQEQM